MYQARRRLLKSKRRFLAAKLSLQRRDRQSRQKSDPSSSVSSASEEDEESSSADMPPTPAVPSLFTHPTVPRDEVRTQTSEDEDRVVQSCLPLLSGQALLKYGPGFLTSHGVPHLLRDRHIHFLHESLEVYPPAFKSMDASRPWMLYWNLTALPLIGEDSSPYGRR